MINKIFTSFAILFLCSCGYHVGQGDITSGYSTITIPYIDGDEYGLFTAELAREISVSGPLRYERCEGELTLRVSVIDYNYENVGFRYDRDKDGEKIKSVIPSETRVQAITEVSLIETASGSILLGPVQITAYLDFDHEYYNSWNGVNITSLGQLTDYDAAVDGSFKPLYQILAHKIADYVYDSW